MKSVNVLKYLVILSMSILKILDHAEAKYELQTGLNTILNKSSFINIFQSRKSTEELCELNIHRKLEICCKAWYKYKEVNASRWYAFPALEAHGMICQKVFVKISSTQWVSAEAFECTVNLFRILENADRPTDNFFITTGCGENRFFLLQRGTLEDAHPSFVDTGIENCLEIFAYVQVEYP